MYQGGIMSKGLDALKEIKSEPFSWEKLKDSLDIIEKELKEYKQHEEILNDYGLTLANFREACLLYAQWKSAGLCWADYDKQKKALEIIKNKDVHKTMLSFTQSADEYNHFIDDVSEELQLTQAEYDLLKEVLL